MVPHGHLDDDVVTAEEYLKSAGLSTPALVGICLGGSVFLVSMLAVSCFCYRRRSYHYSKPYVRKFPERPLNFRKSTAVKSPGTQGHYLRKSPSPSSGFKTPPGGKSKTPSPPGYQSIPGHQPQASPTPKALTPPEAGGGFLHQHCTTANAGPPKKRASLSPQTEIQEIVKFQTEQERQNQITSKTLGQLFFRVRYMEEKMALLVTIVKCKDLPARDTTMGNSDPYVKLQLLPDKDHKVKTRVLRKTQNPEYDEDFTFYGITPKQLKEMSLHFVVLSFDRYSRDDVIGEVIYPMNSPELEGTSMEQPVSISREIAPRSLKIRSQGRGELLVSLCHQPAANRLTVVILKARSLPKMDITGLSDPYVKIYLLYKNQRIAKKKTHVKKRTLNPVFNESFVFDLPNPSSNKDLSMNGDTVDASPSVCLLEDISLEFLLLDWDRVTKNEVIGRLELGGPKCAGSALHHWKEVCNSPRRQIAEWHKLRE